MRISVLGQQAKPPKLRDLEPPVFIAFYRQVTAVKFRCHKCICNTAYHVAEDQHKTSNGCYRKHRLQPTHGAATW